MGEPDPHFEIEEFEAGDGYRWRYRRFSPSGPPLGIVVGIHGIQSHGGWYEYSCSRLREAGFLVYFLDRRGSGLNQQARGDAPGFRRLVDDVAEFLRFTRDSDVRIEETLDQTSSSVGAHSSSKKPAIFLMAISWGGKLAVALQLRHPGLVDRLALLCPGFYPCVQASFREKVSIAWSRFFSPERLFPVPLDDPELFTANVLKQGFIKRDPLALHQATARFLFESVRLDAFIRFASTRVRVPVLLLLADQDRIIRNEPTRRFVKRFKTQDREVIEYRGAHHTLEFEPNPNGFIEDMRTWMVSKI